MVSTPLPVRSLCGMNLGWEVPWLYLVTWRNSSYYESMGQGALLAPIRLVRLCALRGVVRECQRGRESKRERDYPFRIRRNNWRFFSSCLQMNKGWVWVVLMRPAKTVRRRLGYWHRAWLESEIHASAESKLNLDRWLPQIPSLKWLDLKVMTFVGGLQFFKRVTR